MRIISGSIKGKKLTTPQGNDTRPTTDRVKESIFNIIQFHVRDAKVLDLFAGTGQMGLECLSRGASYAVFCDNNKKSCEVILQNINTCGFKEQAKLLNTDYSDFLKKCDDKFDIIFLDPPYGKQALQNSLNLLNSFDILSKNGIIVCESALADVTEIPLEFKVQKEYKYGAIKVMTLEFR